MTRNNEINSIKTNGIIIENGWRHCCYLLKPCTYGTISTLVRHRTTFSCSKLRKTLKVVYTPIYDIFNETCIYICVCVFVCVFIYIYIYTYIYIYIYIYIKIWYLGFYYFIMVWVFVKGPGDLGSIPSRVIPKTQTVVLDAYLAQYGSRVSRVV